MDLKYTWPEVSMTLLFVIGFIFALMTATSRFMAFLLILLWGMIFGRLWYRLRESFRFPWGLIIFGFLLGFMLALAVMGYNSRWDIIILITLYFIGMWVSYNVHSKGLLKSTEY